MDNNYVEKRKAHEAFKAELEVKKQYIKSVVKETGKLAAIISAIFMGAELLEPGLIRKRVWPDGSEESILAFGSAAENASREPMWPAFLFFPPVPGKSFKNVGNIEPYPVSPPGSVIVEVDSIWVGRQTALLGTDPTAFLGYEPCYGWGCGAMYAARVQTKLTPDSLMVWVVTSLDNDDSPGTLGAAIDSARQHQVGVFNAIVFATGGTSYSHTDGSYELTVDTLHNLMILGQTARGRGITSLRPFDQNAVTGVTPTNLVVRYFSVRAESGRCWQTIGADSVVLDHLSGSHCGSGSGGGIWDVDAADTVGEGQTRSQTIQYTVHAWGDPRLSTIGLSASTSYPLSNPCTGHGDDGNCNREYGVKGIIEFTMYENAFFGPSRRAPHISCDTCGLYKHFIYNLMNVQSAGVRTATGELDVVGFWGDHGPGGSVALRGSYLEMKNFSCWDSVFPPNVSTCRRSMYAYDIHTEQNNFASAVTVNAIFKGAVTGGDSLAVCKGFPGNINDDSWDGACSGNNALIPNEWIRTTPRPKAVNPLANWTQPILTQEIIDTMLAHVGDSRVLNCSGRWDDATNGYTRRHQWDQDRVDEYYAQTGLSSDLSNYPEETPDLAYRASGGVTLCVDTDSDQMPDSFELEMTNGASATSLVSTDECGRYGHMCIEYYWWAGMSDVLSTRLTVTNSVDSLALFLDDVWAGSYINPLPGSYWWTPEESYNKWGIGTEAKITYYYGTESGPAQNNSIVTIRGDTTKAPL